MLFRSEGACHCNDCVVTDRLISTGRGMGCSLDLGLELVRLLKGEDEARELKSKIQYDRP